VGVGGILSLVVWGLGQAWVAATGKTAPTPSVAPPTLLFDYA
jgi:hypothetical protein